MTTDSQSVEPILRRDIQGSGRETLNLYESLQPSRLELLITGVNSLGRLLIRSACHYGVDGGQEWVSKDRRVFYLGSPHFGTPWENPLTDRLLLRRVAQSDHVLARRFTRLYAARGAAIRDLRYPHLVDADWQRAACLPTAQRLVGGAAGAGSVNRPAQHE